MNIQLGSGTDGLVDGIRNTDWTRRSSYARGLSKLWYSMQSPTNLLDLEWDYLIVLDAARADLFETSLKDVRPELVDDVERIISVGSTTIEWGVRTFEGRDTSQYGYVTASPMYEEFGTVMDGELEFDPLVDLSDSDTFARFGTIPPHIVSDEVRDRCAERPDGKWIVHYLQPHLPFIAPGIDHPDLPAYVTDPTDPSVWDLLEQGDVTLEEVREAYLENHRYVLQEVLWLLGELPPGKDVLITTDHGNVFGKWHGYYGHGEGMYLPSLVSIPALRVETGESLCERPPEANPKQKSEDVAERLTALGYA